MPQGRGTGCISVTELHTVCLRLRWARSKRKSPGPSQASLRVWQQGDTGDMREWNQVLWRRDAAAARSWTRKRSRKDPWKARPALKLTHPPPWDFRASREPGKYLQKTLTYIIPSLDYFNTNAKTLVGKEVCPLSGMKFIGLNLYFSVHNVCHAIKTVRHHMGRIDESDINKR